MNSEFEFLKTSDGSPTLTWRSSSGASEAMHNSKGALSESLYIYYSAIRFVTKKQWPPRFLSVGLGLGYNELIIAAHCLKEHIPFETISIETFEKSQFLQTKFIKWLRGSAPSQDELEWWRNYYDLADQIAKNFNISSTDLKEFLNGLFANNQWTIKGELSDHTPVSGTFSAILYDAFSSNTDPHLWDEKFLEKLIENSCLPNSVFVTYAAKGSLNRALRNQGFILEMQRGFAGKRQSTFAVRVHRSEFN